MNSTMISRGIERGTLVGLDSSVKSDVAGLLFGRGDSFIFSSELCFRFGLVCRFGLVERRGEEGGIEVVDIEVVDKEVVDKEFANLSPSEMGALMTLISLIGGSYC
jgi:hypothetical protein